VCMGRAGRGERRVSSKKYKLCAVFHSALLPTEFDNLLNAAEI
jgi:hypothetical protein